MLFHSDTVLLIQGQPVFALIPCCCVFSREEANAKVIVFDLTTGSTTLEVSTLSEFGCSLMQRFQIIVIL